MAEYAYRKEFGLSQKQLEEEPLEVYYHNQDIMSAMSEIERSEQKKMERQSKR